MTNIKDFEIRLEGWHTGDPKTKMVQGEALAEVLIREMAIADREDDPWIVTGIREITSGYVLMNGTEVIHQTSGRRGIITDESVISGQVGVWWIGGNESVRVYAPDLVGIS